MSPAQNKLYLRRWGAVCRALNWRMAKGRLHPAAVLAGSAPREQVAAAAAARALQHHRATTADDLRHGCHVVALGRDKSHKDFSNRDFDAVLTLWGDGRSVRGLLLDADDLGSEVHRAHPELKTRERHLHFLRNDCLGGYVVSESERIFKTKHWEALATDKLAALSNHLRNRPHCLKVQPATTDPDWTV